MPNTLNGEKEKEREDIPGKLLQCQSVQISEKMLKKQFHLMF